MWGIEHGSSEDFNHRATPPPRSEYDNLYSAESWCQYRSTIKGCTIDISIRFVGVGVRKCNVELRALKMSELVVYHPKLAPTGDIAWMRSSDI